MRNRCHTKSAMFVALRLITLLWQGINGASGISLVGYKTFMPLIATKLQTLPSCFSILSAFPVDSRDEESRKVTLVSLFLLQPFPRQFPAGSFGTDLLFFNPCSNYPRSYVEPQWPPIQSPVWPLVADLRANRNKLFIAPIPLNRKLINWDCMLFY